MRLRAIRPTFLLVSILAVQAIFLSPAFSTEKRAQVQETVLPNGLKVLTKEVRTAPVVSFMVWYKVGSRNEQLGKTGLSHFLEHMQFKGTTTFGKGEMDSLIRRNGGMSNAATWKDYTYYYATLSSDKLELAMHIESDRMVNSLIDPEEFRAEMTVVRSELEGRENNPQFLMYYELYSTAFKAHPYQWPTIGWRNDVETITRDDIYEYYRTYYHPNNATVVIVGDFDARDALSMVEEYFGDIQRGPEPPAVTAVEPEQLGERTAEIRRSGSAYRVMMGFHTPAIGHPDIYALDVLGIVLSQGTSSRLYRSLVDGELATEAWAGSTISTDPDLFLASATARQDVSLEDLEAALLAEIELVKSEPITDDELQKALNQLEAQFIFSNDSVTSQARMLGEYETKYSWRFLDEYLDNVREVTKADVQRVAQTYLTSRNRTVVTFIPESAGQLDMSTPGPVDGEVHYRAPDTIAVESFNTETASEVLSGTRPPQTDIADPTEPTRVVLDNGLVVIIHENRSNATVAVEGSVNAGSMFDPDGKLGLASMTAGMLFRGTSNRTADEIAFERDYSATSLNSWAETEYTGFSGYALSQNFDLLLDLLSDALRNPTFPDDELERLRSRRLSGIRQEQDNPRSLAFRQFFGSVYPQTHPFYRPSVEEDLANTSAVTREDIVEFHNNRYGPYGAVIVVVGDVNTQEALSKIRSYFGDWEGGSADRPQIPYIELQPSVTKEIISMPDKSQVDVVLGYASSLKRSDPDFYSAMVMNFTLGGGGALGSRLGRIIRDEMGLVYGVYSTFEAGLGAGPWYAYLGTNPENLDTAVETLLKETALMRDEGATQDQVDEAIDFIAGSFPVRRLEKNNTIAETLHAAEIHDLGIDYIRQYENLYRSVTLEQVNEAAKKHLHPDRYTIVIAGPYRDEE